MKDRHQPVLLEEAIEALSVVSGGLYVDATYGRGGHAQEIARRMGGDGRLLVMDRDPQAVAAARATYGGDPRVTIVKGQFSMLGHYITQMGVDGKLNGVLFDLGVSSPQLDQPGRGFAFFRDGPLDMRMDPEQGESASDWLNRVEEKDLVQVLFRYGEERYARRIARAIVAARHQAPLQTTGELARLIEQAVPRRERDRHPATRSFQAIRIYVNRELEEIEQALPQALCALAPGGRLVVISFHSLEDRIVKRFMRNAARGDDLPPELPVTGDAVRPRARLLGRARHPAADEIAGNPRARSAVLRAVERTEVPCE
jgi:16S rRNA (cytosine1402-N4)-methyltransferase